MQPAQLLELDLGVLFALVAYPLGRQDAAAGRGLLQAHREIDALAVQFALVVDDIAAVHAHAQRQAVRPVVGCVAALQKVLQVEREQCRVGRSCESSEVAVAATANDTTVAHPGQFLDLSAQHADQLRRLQGTTVDHSRITDHVKADNSDVRAGEA